MILYRPDYAKKNYQDLRKDVCAIEPPIWMAREIKPGAVYCDEMIGQDITKYKNDVQIFPSGNQPSSNQENGSDAKEILRILRKKGYGTLSYYYFVSNNIEYPTTWEGVDLSKYRAHNWHCWGGKSRQGYGVLFTSVGCPFMCRFCCVNEFYGGFKQRSLDAIFTDIDILARKRVPNIKILDELFTFDAKRVEKICDHIIAKGYQFNIWAYTRMTNMPDPILKKMKAAGINWLAVGIESGVREIRIKNGKGALKNEEILDLVKRIKDAGINVLANYIIGFYDDARETVIETVDFASKVMAEYANFYSMMPYKGSQVYNDAVRRGDRIAKTSNELSQYGYECLPMATKKLTSKEVLLLRDAAFGSYFSNMKYLK